MLMVWRVAMNRSKWSIVLRGGNSLGDNVEGIGAMSWKFHGLQRWKGWILEKQRNGWRRGIFRRRGVGTEA